MGLNFSSPKLIKNKTIIIICSELPDDEKIRTNIWNLWSSKKDEIKLDNFSIIRDNYTNNWKIIYFHTINDNTYKKINSKYMWINEFDEKLEKYKEFVQLK